MAGHLIRLKLSNSTVTGLQILTNNIAVTADKRFWNLDLEPKITVMILKICRHEQQLLKIGNCCWWYTIL